LRFEVYQPAMLELLVEEGFLQSIRNVS